MITLRQWFPLLQSGSLLAIKNTGSSIYSMQELNCFSANVLIQKAFESAKKASSPHCHLMTKVKLDCLKELLFQNSNLAAEIIDTSNLSTKMTVDKVKPKTANIVANQQIVGVG